jgi:glycosyltransferase involved in cell wall biosynthesis
MSGRPIICFTFVGDVTRDSRLRRMATTAAESAEVFIVQLHRIPDEHAATASAKGDGSEVRVEARGEGSGRLQVITFEARGSLRHSLPRFWRRAPLAMRGIVPDLCVASDLYSLPVAERLARKSGCRLIYDARELYSSIAALRGRGLMQGFWKALERRYGRRAGVVLTVNDSIAAILRQRFRDVRVIRNVPDFAPPGPSRLLRDAADIPVGRRILLSQGGLQRGRGALPLVDALAQLPDCHLVFLGDGDLREDILAAAAFNGVSDRVHVIPAVPSDELSSWTASADLGMCLIENLGRSYYLSLPNKLFEYMAAGVPAVGSDFPEIGRVLRESGAGIAVDPSDTARVVGAIRELLDDADRHARARIAAFQASTQYHWDVERTRFLEILFG